MMKHVQNFGTLGGKNSLGGRLGGKSSKVNEKIQKQLFGGVLTALKNVQIRSFFGPYFLYSVRIKENTDQTKTPYLDTFYAVSVNKGFLKISQNSQENTCTGVWIEQLFEFSWTISRIPIWWRH